MQRKGPLPDKIFARCILQRRFAGLFGCMARISRQSRLVSDAWRRYAARKGRFSRPKPLRERMKRKSCHGSPPGNAPRRYLATVGRRRAQFASILPSASAPRGGHHDEILPLSAALKTHHGEISPWPAAQERTVAISCHGSLPQEYSSTTSCREGPGLPGLAAKSQRRHVAGRHRPSEASANSTTHAGTSKKP